MLNKTKIGTEEWAEKLVESLGKIQENNDGFPCPRCGHKMRSHIVTNALSRRANVYICNNCGHDEAMLDLRGEDPWPFIRWSLPLSFLVK